MNRRMRARRGGSAVARRRSHALLDGVHASARQFCDLAESLPQLVWTCTGDGLCDYMSPQWVAYTGITAKNQLGHAWLTVVHPDDVEHTQSCWSAATVSGAAFESEHRIRRNDGAYRLFKTRLTPSLDAEGCVARWIGSNTDIHDLRNARQATALADDGLEQRENDAAAHLALARHDLEHLLDALPLLIAYVDPDQRVRFANRALETWLGFGPRTMVGLHLKEVLGACYAPILSSVERALRGEPQQVEQEAPNRAGVTSGQLEVRTLTDEADGQVRGIYLFARDLTEQTEGRQRLAKAMRDSESLLSVIHQHAIVSVADRTGKIIDANDAFCVISGYERHELLGQDHRIINSQLHDRSFWRGMWRTLGAGKPWRHEIRNRAKDGSLYWVDTVIAPFLDEHGKIAKYISIRFDITAAKRDELALRDAHAKLHAVTRQLESAQRITHVGSWELELATGTVTWSEELYQIAGLEREGAAPDYAAQARIYTQESLARLTPALEHTMATGEGYELSLNVVRPDGTLRTAIARAEAVRDASGAVQRLIGTLQDVTERERVADEVRRLSERLGLATSAANMGVWDLNLLDNVLLWDDTMHRLYDIPNGPLPAAYDAWRRALHPEDQGSVEAALTEAIGGRGELDTTFRILRPGGETRYLRAAAVVHRDPVTGQALRVVGVSWDVTDQRAAELALRSSEALQRTILADAGSSIIATDLHGIITLWNARGGGAAGLPRERRHRRVDARPDPRSSRGGSAVRRARGRRHPHRVPFRCARGKDALGQG